MRRRPKWGWGGVFSVRAEDLVRPTPASARHWLGFLGSIVRPITILLAVLLPLTLLHVPEDVFPESHVIEIGDRRALEILERRVDGTHFTLQYLSNVALEDRVSVESFAEELLATYAGPEAVEESCTWIELIPTEWCEHGLCLWTGRAFVAKRTDIGGWNIVETYDTEQ